MVKADRNFQVGRVSYLEGEDIPDDVAASITIRQPDGSIVPWLELVGESEPDGLLGAALVEGTIAEVKARIGDDVVQAKLALEAELAGDNRAGLITHLTALVADGAGESEGEGEPGEDIESDSGEASSEDEEA